MATRALHQLLDQSASRFPEKVAVEESVTGNIRYDELAHLSDRVRDRLREMGVEVGDRVGICARKSGDVVAAIFGIMKAGAAYIPTDPTAPAQRNAFIFQNCAVKVVIIESRLVDRLDEEFKQVGFAPAMLVIDGVGGGVPLRHALDRLDSISPAASLPSAVPDPSH